MKQDDQTEITAFVCNDARSKEEIFNSIRNRIQGRSAYKMSDQEAVESAHRLIRFFQNLGDKSLLATPDALLKN